MDTDALKKAKPLFVYFYVDPIANPMDPNYKFSRKFELSVLNEAVVDLVNKSFVAKKVALPAEADMKQAKNRARIEVWSPTNVKVGTITVNDENILNKGPFMSFLKARVAKSEMLVKAEIAKVIKARREKEEAAKKESAKND